MAAVAVTVRRPTTTLAFHSQVVAVSVVPWVAVQAAAMAGLRIDATPLLILSVLNAMHVAVTLVFYADREAWPILRSDPGRYFLIPAALMCAGVGVMVAGPPDVKRLVFTAFYIWQVHHFSKQNLGMLSFHARSRGVSGPNASDRLALRYASFGAAALLVHRDPNIGPTVDAPILLVAAALLGSVAAWFVVQSILEGGRVGGVVLAILYWSPLLYVDDLGVAVLAISSAHAAQYFLMISGLRGGRTEAAARSITVALLVSALTVGMSHALKNEISTWHFGLHFGFVCAHFVADAGLWKMSQPLQRGYMRRRFEFLG